MDSQGSASGPGANGALIVQSAASARHKPVLAALKNFSADTAVPPDPNRCAQSRKIEKTGCRMPNAGVLVAYILDHIPCCEV
jgi:hypothetical protein